MEKKCFYCNQFYTTKDDEHVFPDGLGGENIYMDCVCHPCNNKFSEFELDLYRNSPLGLIRSIEGVTAKGTAFFKPKLLLYYDEETNIAYEIKQHGKGIEIEISPQIQHIDASFYLEGSTQSKINKLISRLKAWKSNSLIASNFSHKSKNCFKFFLTNSGKYSFEKDFELKKSEEIQIILLPEESEFYPNFTTRLYLDENTLKIRAISTEKALLFINDLLNWTLDNSAINSYGSNKQISGYVSVKQSFNNLSAERAIAKIGANCLLYYFPDSKTSPTLEGLRLFIMNGMNYKYLSMEKKDLLKDNVEKTHNVFFYQLNEALSIRISFFNGQLIYQIIIPDLIVFKPHQYRRLIIKYTQRSNELQNEKDYLLSFNF